MPLTTVSCSRTFPLSMCHYHKTASDTAASTPHTNPQSTMATEAQASINTFLEWCKTYFRKWVPQSHVCVCGAATAPSTQPTCQTALTLQSCTVPRSAHAPCQQSLRQATT